VVLDFRGQELLRHEKLEPYCDSRDGKAVLEAIIPRTSDSYACLDTPIGRMAVNICRDVRSDVPMILNRLLGVSLLVVPAYSKRLDFVIEEARILGQRQLAVVAVANSRATALSHVAGLYAPVRSQRGQIVAVSDLTPQGVTCATPLHVFELSNGPKRRGAVAPPLEVVV
jgi:predicted amidohydrolase